MGMAELTYRDAVARGIAQEMARDKDVVFLGEDVAKAGGVFKATVGLYEQFGPLRVRDTPISEQAILGAAMGAAMTGLKPIAEQRGGGLLQQVDPFLQGRRDQLVALAARYALPAIYERRDFAAAGGLMSYGTSLRDALRLVGNYTGRVLKGEKPADLPVQQAVKVELIINLRTAKALGLDVPMSMLIRVDEVIE
jgi:hypothetical protein